MEKTTEGKRKAEGIQRVRISEEKSNIKIGIIWFIPQIGVER